MSYTKKKRASILNFIKESLKNNIPEVGGRVYLSYPPFPLPTTSLPQIYIGSATSDVAGGTTRENQEKKQLSIIAYVKKQSGLDLEITKANIQDDIEAVLLPLKADTDFRELATDINILGTDSGPDALLKIGYQAGVYPPYGAVRIDVEITYYYVIM